MRLRNIDFLLFPIIVFLSLRGNDDMTSRVKVS